MPLMLLPGLRANLRQLLSSYSQQVLLVLLLSGFL